MAILSEVDENEIDLSGDEGVMKKILQEGIPDDQPTPQCRVSVHYTGKHQDGEIFDCSYDRNEPFEFVLFKGMTIEGFDLGVASMKKGEKARLTIQAGYAIKPGQTQMSKIFPNQEKPPPTLPDVPENLSRESKLIFEIELVDWKPADLSPSGDHGIVRHVIKRPKSWNMLPNDGSTVTVHLTGSYEDRVFDDRDVTFILGETSDDEVIIGIQEALVYFANGETSKLIIRPQYAFGKDGNEAFEIPPNAVVEYVVTLNEFERVLDAWKLKSKDSFDMATKVKNKATDFLKQEKYNLAIKLYERANTYRITLAGEEFKEGVNLNIALCHLKLKNFAEAKQMCDSILEKSPKNVKALYRRGLSKMGQHEPSAALEDFEKAHELHPLNKAIANQITVCKHEIKKEEVNDKQLFKKMLK